MWLVTFFQFAWLYWREPLRCFRTRWFFSISITTYLYIKSINSNIYICLFQVSPLFFRVLLPAIDVSYIKYIFVNIFTNLSDYLWTTFQNIFALLFSIKCNTIIIFVDINCLLVGMLPVYLLLENLKIFIFICRLTKYIFIYSLYWLRTHWI